MAAVGGTDAGSDGNAHGGPDGFVPGMVLWRELRLLGGELGLHVRVPRGEPRGLFVRRLRVWRDRPAHHGSHNGSTDPRSDDTRPLDPTDVPPRPDDAGAHAGTHSGADVQALTGTDAQAEQVLRIRVVR